MVRAAQQLIVCLLFHNWKLLGNKLPLFFSCVFITTINNKCCVLGPSINSAQLKKLFAASCGRHSWIHCHPSRFLLLPVCAIYYQGDSSGVLRNSDRPSSTQQWLLCSDYRCMRLGHRITSRAARVLLQLAGIRRKGGSSNNVACQPWKDRRTDKMLVLVTSAGHIHTHTYS